MQVQIVELHTAEQLTCVDACMRAAAAVLDGPPPWKAAARAVCAEDEAGGGARGNAGAALGCRWPGPPGCRSSEYRQC